MQRIIIFLFSTVCLFSGCKKGFLDRPPLDQLTDDNFWSNEKNVRTFSYGFYPTYFTGYGHGWTWGDYFTGETLNDEFGQTSPSQYPKVVPSTGGGWSFTNVRKANIFLDRLQRADMSEEAKAHWTGVARFFRGMAYYLLVERFGDVPWYDKAVSSEQEDSLYIPRDPRQMVMKHVLEDFQYAAAHVRESDGEKGLTVNKWVVLAFMSKVFLFEGTWEKYHNVDQQAAKTFLEAAKWAAGEVINNGGFSFNYPYRESFNALDLSSNQEMILYKQYESGQVTHTLVSYVNREGQTGPNKDVIDDYLCSDGLPIELSGDYEGDKGIGHVMANRDSRMAGTFAPDLRPVGYDRPAGTFFGASSTGYATLKFLNEEIMNDGRGLSNVNPTDAPIIRLGEVMVNYAEAAQELGGVTQADLDMSINKLRSRPGGNLPPLEVIGGQPAVNGHVYDDPKRDPTVSSMLWEIRRERRVEMSMEGVRDDDLRRWKKLDYMDMVKHPDLNRGAWIKKSDYPNLSASVIIEGGGNEGYIKPASVLRVIDNDRIYLLPLPLDQIQLYKDHGVTLAQNPGWEE
ncbi:RagB/SusD family nutrient uptake outer membrane protein [Arachidicoccus terrestris]|uniref:RagB/SusD family nutrient uptake outer membrane protein n=1 Tax=Arachidicoccus terrestris TaxID=2875539 RepID=UPI001CC53288|nr:RagB/SusD family nutrient uptake outer membrane protein [Arachidicoccus terrestris]UAY57138.1 RagB/SusD family nutrient uptake outer membrane protein [Arachidicoccus terrestris]